MTHATDEWPHERARRTDDWYVGVLIHQSEVLQRMTTEILLDITRFGYATRTNLFDAELALAALTRASVNRERILEERGMHPDSPNWRGAHVTLTLPGVPDPIVCYMSFGQYDEDSNRDSFGIDDDDVFFYVTGIYQLEDMRDHPDEYDFAVKSWELVPA